MKHILYKTTCVKTGRYYLGMHSSRQEHDAYLGSGLLLKRSIKAHGRESHIRENLELFSSRKELSIAEAEIVKVYLSDPLCMNLVPGGEGGNKVHWTSARRKLQSDLAKDMKRTDAHCANISLSLTGKPQTKQRKENISKSLLGRHVHPDTKKKISDAQPGAVFLLGLFQTPMGLYLKLTVFKNSAICMVLNMALYLEVFLKAV